MNSTTSLKGSHLRTYQAIFRHPVSHNLGWRDVHALFRHIGQVDEGPNGSLKVLRNGRSLVLHPSHAKDVALTDEMMALRHFLEQSETAEADLAEPADPWLLLIDHHEARLFRSQGHGAAPQQILPHAPKDNFRHAPHAQEFTTGQETPEPNGFFEPIAQALKTAGQILVFGTGTGTSSEMDQFIAWLKLHHPLLAERIIGSLVVDEHHLTDNQLLAKARGFHAEGASVSTAGHGR